MPKHERLILLFSFLISLLVNAGGITTFDWIIKHSLHRTTLAPQSPTNDEADDDEKDADPDYNEKPEFTPGIENGAPATVTWIGFDEYKEQLARQAEVEQAAFTMADGTPGQPVPDLAQPQTQIEQPATSVEATNENESLTPTMTDAQSLASTTPVEKISTAPPPSDKNVQQTDPQPQETTNPNNTQADAANETPPTPTTEAQESKKVTDVAEPITSTTPNNEEPRKPLDQNPLPEFKTPLKTDQPAQPNDKISNAKLNEPETETDPGLPPADDSTSTLKPNQPDRTTAPTKPDSTDNKTTTEPEPKPNEAAETATQNQSEEPVEPPEPTTADSAKQPVKAVESTEIPDALKPLPVSTPSSSPPFEFTNLETTELQPPMEAPATSGNSQNPSPEPRDPKAVPSEKESQATSTKKIPAANWRAGKPLAIEGMEIRPYPLFRHIVLDSNDTFFSVTGFTGSIRTNPVITLQFDRNGKAAHIKIYRNTGYPEFDRKYLRSWLSRWTANDKRLAKLKENEMTDPIVFTLIFIPEPEKKTTPTKDASKPANERR